MNKTGLDNHLRGVLKKAQQSYRRAIAEQVRGNDGQEAWEDFQEACAALLLASWLYGARASIDKAGIPDDAVAGMIEDDPKPPIVTTFDRGVPLSTSGFGSKWAAKITSWFRRRVPISRDAWERLIEAASLSAKDVAEHERVNALVDIRKRSPFLDSLLRGMAPGKRGPSPVKRVIDTTFFVTGMDPEQTRQTQELIAQVIEEKPGKSVIGKRIKAMNLGDFVTTTQLRTGTDLTTARLETVLRTNTNRALTEGTAEVLREPQVQAFVPLVQFSATKDNRTRDTHRQFDGFVGTMDDFDRAGCAPPVGFNCRCALIPVPVARAMREGWVRPDGSLNAAAVARHNGRRVGLLTARQIPDPGFVTL